MPKVKVKAAVLERSRRSTAGKRMASLVGQAQEDDDAFWSHSIWSEAGGGFSGKKGGSRKRRRGDDDESSSSSGSEEGGGGEDDEGSVSSGEGSYRMSEDDSEAAVDKFDSDFDESESDDDDEGEDGEGEEEQELRAEERREKATKRKKNQRLGVVTVPLKSSSSAGRELMKKKTGKTMTKRGPLGEGWNVGLVLNWPPPPLGGGVAAATAGAGSKPASAAPVHTQLLDSKSTTTIPVAQTSASMPASSLTKPQHIPSKPASIDTKQIIAQKPPASPIKPSLRAAATTTTTSTTTAPPTKVKAPSAKRSRQRHTAVPTTEKKKNKKQHFTQEEMILESIKSTETESAKWLNARKRMKEEAVQSEKAMAAKKSSSNHNPISRFHSRRGGSNTLTFMDMDHLPEIFTRRHGGGGGGGRGGRALLSSRSINFGDSTSSSTTTGPQYPKRRRLDSTASETSESATTTTQTATAASEKAHEKCIITGKIARYRDPKTMLGYHDIGAYKEIRRRLEAGELKISQQTILRRNNDNRRRMRAMSGSSNHGPDVGGHPNNNATNNKSHFPFLADQPTMIANLSSSARRRPNVKVMVTQDGFPVSPPITKVPLKIIPAKDLSLAEGSQQADRKNPPALPLSAQDDANGKNESAVENFDETNNVAAAGEVVSNTQQQIVMKTISSGRTKDDNSNSKMIVAPAEVISTELQTTFFAKSAESTKPIEMPVQQLEAGATAGAGNDNRDGGGGVPPKAVIAATTSNNSSASATVATNLSMLGTNGKSGPTANDDEGSKNEKIKDSSSKDNARSTDGDNNGGKTVPEITTSNDNRTTIEAN
ncbi:hypothetical protein ACHAXR_012809 [Thalassiosira sp. AJA248-18]